MQLPISRSDQMWNAARLTLVCAIFGEFVSAIVWIFRAPPLVAVVFASDVFFVAIYLLLGLLGRNARKEIWSVVAFLVTVLSEILVICYNHDHYLRNALPFEPLIGIKIVAVMVAMICPPLRFVGRASMLMLATIPAIQYYSWEPEIRVGLSIQEPWVTIVFVGCCGLIYENRLTILELRQKELVHKIKAGVYHKIAHFLLGIQHSLNTPLQVIELNIFALGLEIPSIRERTRLMEKAFSSIRRVLALLAFAETSIDWNEVELPSGIDELEREFEKFIREQSEFGGNQLTNIPTTPPSSPGDS
jgi:hypothetical protein